LTDEWLPLGAPPLEVANAELNKVQAGFHIVPQTAWGTVLPADYEQSIDSAIQFWNGSRSRQVWPTLDTATKSLLFSQAGDVSVFFEQLPESPLQEKVLPKIFAIRDRIENHLVHDGNQANVLKRLAHASDSIVHGPPYPSQSVDDIVRLGIPVNETKYQHENAHATPYSFNRHPNTSAPWVILAKTREGMAEGSYNITENEAKFKLRLPFLDRVPFPVGAISEIPLAE
jgi:hypothetical protein